MYNTITVKESKLQDLINISENHYTEVKSKEVSPSKLSETISSFANASGGDVYVGISENTRTHIRQWNGFACEEEANAIIQTLADLAPLQNYYTISYLRHPSQMSFVLQISVMKTATIVYATNKKAYVRRGAQKNPVDTPDKMRRLELDKGIAHFEDEILPESTLDDVRDSVIMEKFLSNMVPNIEKISWLSKQKLINDKHLTVAGALLFTDEPQVFLPKRSSIKIYRYKTSGAADRDMLDGNPITIEGSAYDQIYAAVKKVKEIIEKIKKLSVGFESITYPDETIHEIITNAVLHRDYSIATDIQIRIFDNRVEVESPGKLPGHVTLKNILESQAARNPKLVRLINKFPEAPNKDVGEGLNTAFEAMAKLRLKEPVIDETENSVLVIIKHEKLASPEELVIEYLETHDTIKNRVGREVTGIKSENTMKNVFYKLRDSGFITLSPGFNWKKTDSFEELVKTQFKK